ncbi:helix-turn-helix transcriptional regulator [Miltoncostaea oceani]|uniref:helix-turn-helix transcriptional regulator n=1 Tax=Miltoncostaea oceani TaxID=2843216 RepID=UPI001C3E421B|nr:helix-turn-helix transcriptional regulator [Miltoncostaea oceani]
MGRLAEERARMRIAGLATRGGDLVSLWREATEVIAPLVPHMHSPCWFTLDPASLLATSHYEQGIPEIPPEWLVHEYAVDDALKMDAVARSPRGAATLHEATGGDPSASIAWTLYMQPYGAEQELLVALRTPAGDTWGMLGLYREPGDPVFSEGEIGFLRAVAPDLAAGVRRALLIGEAADGDGPDAPGVVVLDTSGGVASTTPAGERWLALLPGGGPDGPLPAAVRAVAGRALLADRDHPAVARVRTVDGRWVLLHGAEMEVEGRRRAAVIVEPAHPARISPLLMAAYGLTSRERDVTRLVLQGRSTDEIAADLVVSPHTVQQHLKSVFEKTGVRSRRELVAGVFFAHYEPRLRDNERRVGRGAPVRGGPVAAPRPGPV